MDAIRSLNEADGLAIELRRQLAGILGVCAGHKTKPGFVGRAVLSEQMKLVAGAGSVQGRTLDQLEMTV